MRTGLDLYSVSELARVARRSWRLPSYQRSLVWSPDQALRLVQSVYEGYPIGSFLIWERSLGDVLLLDGQQRLAALAGTRCGMDAGGPQVGWSCLGRCWALGPQSQEDRLLTLRWYQETAAMAMVQEMAQLEAQIGADAWEAAVSALDRVSRARCPVHVLEQATAAQAVEAFRRLNAEGTPIDPVELEELLRAVA
jgi:hypothetical protein